MTHWLQESSISQQHRTAALEVDDRLRRWIKRFPQGPYSRLFDQFYFLFLTAKKEFLDHREPHHIFRLILTFFTLEQKLEQLSTQTPESKHVEFRLLSVKLFYPFSSKEALGCGVGVYLPDSYDRFDEKSILAAVQQIMGPVNLIAESVYFHPTRNRNIQLLYVELERPGKFFTTDQRHNLQEELKDRLLRGISKLVPSVFMQRNQEEVFKNILLLNQQIDAAHDLPQVMISLQEQTFEETVFLITLVTVLKGPLSLLLDPAFVVEHQQVVRTLSTGENVTAYLLRLNLQRDPSLFRSDGSLNFYSARQKASERLYRSLGEFRDCNGGLLLKQEELLLTLRKAFPEVVKEDPELMENFFYSLSPFEKQATLSAESLRQYFAFFLETTRFSSSQIYLLRNCESHDLFFLSVQSSYLLIKEALSSLVTHPVLDGKQMIFSTVVVKDSLYFTCMLSQFTQQERESLICLIRAIVQNEYQQIASQKVVRIGLENNISSLDPRIGGDDASPGVLKMLFEGLMRFNREGQIEAGIAEKVTISKDGKEYTFHLRSSVWNDGTPLTAYDFEYAWKTLLSPGFKTAFDYFFHPILGAKGAKMGKLPIDKVGIRALDDQTLEVKLAFPTSYFLQLTAHPLYSPVHRLIDQKSPEWPSQAGKSYPCNGPFELKVNHPNTGYHLTKNPLYWNPDPASIDKFVLTRMSPRQIPDLFRKKEIDLISHPFTSNKAIYSANKEAKAIEAPLNLVCWCVLNTQYGPFNSVESRQAMAAAVDLSPLSPILSLPIIPAHSPLPLLHSQMQTRQGPVLTKRFADLPSKIEIIFDGSKEREMLAKTLQKAWKESLEIECELKPLPWPSLFQRVTEGTFQVCIISWTSWIDDPIYTLNAFRYAREKINFPKWENPSFQRLLESADQEENTDIRQSYLKQAEEILIEEMPVIPLYYQSCQALTQADLDLKYHPIYGHFNLLRTIQKRGNSYENS